MFDYRMVFFQWVKLHLQQKWLLDHLWLVQYCSVILSFALFSLYIYLDLGFSSFFYIYLDLPQMSSCEMSGTQLYRSRPWRRFWRRCAVPCPPRSRWPARSACFRAPTPVRFRFPWENLPGKSDRLAASKDLDLAQGVTEQIATTQWVKWRKPLPKVTISFVCFFCFLESVCYAINPWKLILLCKGFSRSIPVFCRKEYGVITLLTCYNSCKSNKAYLATSLKQTLNIWKHVTGSEVRCHGVREIPRRGGLGPHGAREWLGQETFEVLGGSSHGSYVGYGISRP